MWMVAANFWQTYSPSRLAWSEGWHPPGAQLTFIKWTGWTLAIMVMMTAASTLSWFLLLLLLRHWFIHSDSEKAKPLLFLNNSSKNESILIIFGAPNPWEICDVSVTELYSYCARVCSVYDLWLVCCGRWCECHWWLCRFSHGNRSCHCRPSCDCCRSWCHKWKRSASTSV